MDEVKEEKEEDGMVDGVLQRFREFKTMMQELGYRISIEKIPTDKEDKAVPNDAIPSRKRPHDRTDTGDVLAKLIHHEEVSCLAWITSDYYETLEQRRELAELRRKPLHLKDCESLPYITATDRMQISLNLNSFNSLIFEILTPYPKESVSFDIYEEELKSHPPVFFLRQTRYGDDVIDLTRVVAIAAQRTAVTHPTDWTNFFYHVLNLIYDETTPITLQMFLSCKTHAPTRLFTLLHPLISKCCRVRENQSTEFLRFLAVTITENINTVRRRIVTNFESTNDRRWARSRPRRAHVEETPDDEKPDHMFPL